MKNLILFALFVSIFCMISGETISGGYGGIQILGSYQKMDDLNSRLSGLGINIDETVYGVGGCGYGIVKGFVLGGYGYRASRTYAVDSLKIDYSYNSGMFEFGPLFDLKILNLGIIFGLGGGGEDINLRPNLTDISFDSLLSSPGRVSSLNRGGLEVSASLLMLFKMRDFIALSVKGGIAYGFGWQWALEDGATLSHSPNDKPLRVNVSLGLLFGGSGKD